jgi:hypothetical protein
MSDGKHHRTKTRRPLLLLVCLLLLIVLSSITLILALKNNEDNPTAQNHSSTSTPTISNTPTTSSTTGNTPTATATPSQTPSSTATSTATSTTPTLTGSPALTPTATPFFSDDFADNSKAWTVSQENDASGYLRLLNNNQLTLRVTNHQPLIEVLPTNANYGDFILTTTFTFLEGDNHDSVGLYLRGNGRLDRDYRIDIFGDNMLSLTKEFLNSDDQPQTMTLQEPAISPLLKPVGEQNILTVMMKGPYILIMINGQTAASIVDSDYAQGQIALFAHNGETSNGVSVAFHQIEVKPIPTPPAADATATATGTTTATPATSTATKTVPPGK